MRRSMKHLAAILAVAMTLQVTAVSALTEEVWLEEDAVTGTFDEVDAGIEEEVLTVSEDEEIVLPVEELLEIAAEPDEADQTGENAVLEGISGQDDLMEEEAVSGDDPASQEVVSGEDSALEDPGRDEAGSGDEQVVEDPVAFWTDEEASDEPFAQEEAVDDEAEELPDGFLEEDLSSQPQLQEMDTDLADETVDLGSLSEEAFQEDILLTEMDESQETAENLSQMDEDDTVEVFEAEIVEEEVLEEDASAFNAADTMKVATAFPDAAFQTYIKKNFTDGSDTITTAQLKKIKAADTLDLSGSKVTNLKGIEYFTSIETLKLSNDTSIKTVNLSKNTTLVLVDLSGDKALKTLTLTGCSKIQKLTITGCKALESVTLTPCTNLQTLEANDSGLTSLSLSKNTKLQTLNCSNTQIETLDVSANTALRQLECANARLSSIALGTNSNLFYLDLSDNKRLTSIDVSKVTALRELKLPNTAVVNLDASNHASLYKLDLSNTPLKTLNLSGCKAIESLDINNRTGNGWNVTTITTLNVSNCTALRYLYCNETAVNALTITGCTTLEQLDCSHSALSSLALTDCAALHYLNCAETAITGLDISKNKNLRTLDCSNTGISKLDVTGNESLTYINVEETGITTLDLRKSPNLTSLYCGRNMTTIYLNELKDNVSGIGRTILNRSKYNNQYAKIIVYFPLNGISWNKTTRNSYSDKSANLTWWPYDPQTGTIYCKNSEEKYGKKTGEHNWVTVYDKKPTCSTSGKKHIECKACGEVKSGTSEVVKATGKHSYSKWSVKVPANAYSAAIEHKVCKYCDHEVTRTKGEKLSTPKTVFRNLQPRVSAVSSKKIKITWNTLPNGAVYYVYGAKCGNTLALLKTVKAPKKAAKTLSYTHSGLKAGTYYKYAVVAYAKDSDGNLTLIESSSHLHVPTTGGKFTEYKKTKANRKSVTLSVNRTARLKAAGTKKKASKTIRQHVAVRYESSNKKVVTVNKKGKVTARAAGTAYVYVYMQDGVFARVKITVQ